MKTFDGWRAVGRAMRWARRQDGVTVERVARADVRARIYRSPEDKIVWVSSLPGSTWFRTYSGRVGSAECTPNAAAEGLRVLAALDLIPAELATDRHRQRVCHIAVCDDCGTEYEHDYTP